MSLRSLIEEKYKSAVKLKNIKEIGTLRLIKSAIKDKDIASRSNQNKDGINDTEILSLLDSLGSTKCSREAENRSMFPGTGSNHQL